MNKLSQLFSNEMSHAIGWTIIHSLWQCALIALAIAISYAFTKKAQAATRYWINTLGLLSCIITSAITFYMNFKSSVQIEIIGDFAINSMQPTQQTVYTQNISEIINQHIHQIVFCWIIGFGFYITKYLIDYFYCQHIKHHNNKLPSETMQQMFNELKNCLGISDKIQLRISEAIHIPCVIGHFSPVVLLPASILLRLSTQQIKVILLHELGHVSRRDYLISSIQTLITSLYFFNPFTRWISSKIDEERENACDDIAVFVSGDPLFYAHTLKEFAEIKNDCSAVVAITGKSNLLMNRIKRLFIRDNSFSKTYGKAITIMILALLSIGFSVSGHSETKAASSDNFPITTGNIKLSEMLSLTQQTCPTESEAIKLKHPDSIASIDYTDSTCKQIVQVIQQIDNNFSELEKDQFPLSFEKEKLSSVLEKLAAKCPNIKDQIILRNPDNEISIKSDKFSCSGVKSLIENLDSEIKSGRETAMENAVPRKANYTEIVMNNVIIPKEIKTGNSETECNSSFSIDEKGNVFDIVPNCKSSNSTVASTFNELLTQAIRNSTFEQRLLKGKPVAAQNIRIINTFRMGAGDTKLQEK